MVQEAAAKLMSDRSRSRRQREQYSRNDRDVLRRGAKLADEERQHRAEAAIDELQAEDDPHQQHEVLKRQNVPERDASTGRRGLLGARDRLAVHELNQQHGKEIERGGDQ